MGTSPSQDRIGCRSSRPGRLADGLGWGLFGRAGRSWDQCDGRSSRTSRQCNGSLVLCLCSWARGLEGKQRCSRDGTGVAAPPGCAQYFVIAVNLGTAVSGPSQGRLTLNVCRAGGLAGWLAGVRRSGTSVSKTARRRCVVEGKGLQEKRRVPKGWSGTEWPSLAHNSLATLGPLKLQAYHLSSPLFLTAKGLKGAPKRDCVGTLTRPHTVTLVHCQVEGKGLGSLTPSCRSHSRGVVVFLAFAATSHHHQLPCRWDKHTASILLYSATTYVPTPPPPLTLASCGILSRAEVVAHAGQGSAGLTPIEILQYLYTVRHARHIPYSSTYTKALGWADVTQSLSEGALGLLPLSIVIINIYRPVHDRDRNRVTDMTDRPLPVAPRGPAGPPSAVDCLIGFRGLVSIHRQTKAREKTSDGCHVPYHDIVSNCFWPPAEGSGPPPNLAAARRVGAQRFHSSQLCLSQRQTQEAVSAPFVSRSTPNAFFLSSFLTSMLTVPADSLRTRRRRRRSGPQHRARSSLLRAPHGHRWPSPACSISTTR